MCPPTLPLPTLLEQDAYGDEEFNTLFDAVYDSLVTSGTAGAASASGRMSRHGTPDHGRGRDGKASNGTNADNTDPESSLELPSPSAVRPVDDGSAGSVGRAPNQLSAAEAAAAVAADVEVRLGGAVAVGSVFGGASQELALGEEVRQLKLQLQQMQAGLAEVQAQLKMMTDGARQQESARGETSCPPAGCDTVVRRSSWQRAKDVAKAPAPAKERSPPRSAPNENRLSTLAVDEREEKKDGRRASVQFHAVVELAKDLNPFHNLPAWEERSVHWEHSVWNTPLLVGLDPIRGVGSYFLVFLLIINLAVQVRLLALARVRVRTVPACAPPHPFRSSTLTDQARRRPPCCRTLARARSVPPAAGHLLRDRRGGPCTPCLR